MEFNEFPKRVYVGGKGFTVNTAEEEQALLGAKPLQSPPPSCIEQKIEDAKLIEDYPRLNNGPVRTRIIEEELPDKVSPVQAQIGSYKDAYKVGLKNLDTPEKKKRGRPKGAKGKGKKK